MTRPIEEPPTGLKWRASPWFVTLGEYPVYFLALGLLDT